MYFLIIDLDGHMNVVVATDYVQREIQQTHRLLQHFKHAKQ